jgi:PIN domain nuclease of toxin-antitoxin system
MASFYEIAIKLKIGKLELHTSIHYYYQDTIKDLINILPISERYLSTYHQIPLLEEHRDPIDRLIIATAFGDKLSIITADNKFPLYSDFIDIIW